MQGAFIMKNKYSDRQGASSSLVRTMDVLMCVVRCALMLVLQMRGRQGRVRSELDEGRVGPALSRCLKRECASLSHHRALITIIY